MPNPTDPQPKDVAITPVLALLRGAARRAAEAADRAYGSADLLALDPSAMATHAQRGDELWQHASRLHTMASELRLLAGDPGATARQRVDAVNAAHELMSTTR
ncbi:hypothetical protein ACWEQL_00355 [Kitasatospora sp. NPDC004240]